MVNNALFHFNSHINQIQPQIIHTLRFFSGRLAVSNFVINCIEVRAVRWSEIWKFIGSLTLLDFRTGLWRQRMMHRMAG